MDVEILEHAPGSNIKAFLQVPHAVFRGDSNWVPPLQIEVKERLNPKKNPFFLHGEAMYFTAWRNGRPVGRCSAQIDYEHLKLHKDNTGFFGFFDTMNDPEIGIALINSAAKWLAARGIKRMRGPISLNMNEEVGTLIEGFDMPPFIMMGHSRPYQAAIAEAAGLEKAKDLFAWFFESGNLPNRAQKAWEAAHAMPELKFRTPDLSRIEDELRIIMDVFNDAWRDNWGYVPATPEEVKKAGKDLKLIIDKDLVYIVELDGRPVAICVALPNINESIKDLNGKLFPFGLPKLIWRTKVRHPMSARLMMLGVRQELRHIKKYGVLSTAMYVELYKRGVEKGYYWGELSWTLEDNAPINLGIKAMGGRVYKKYRLFEKDIA